MEKISPVKAPLLSWYSKPFYQSVAQNWGGLAFGYLFLLLAVLWIIVMVKLQVSLIGTVDQYFPNFMDQVPSFTVKSGELSVQGEMPLIIRDPDSDQILFYIDTRGDAEPPEGEKIAVFMNKTTMITNEKGKIEQRNFSDVPDIVFDQQKKKEFVNGVNFAKNFLWVLFPIPLFFGFMFCAVQVFIYGLIGMVFRALTNAELTYMQLVRLSVAAITPCLILDTLLKVGNITNPVWALLAALMAMAYLYYGVRANCPDKLPEAKAQ